MPLSKSVLRTIAIGVNLLMGCTPTLANDNFAAWPPLTSTFPSTGGGGVMIKGYDPVIIGDTCTTTFMALIPGPPQAVYSNVATFDAVPTAGGILCTNGRWKAFEGGATGTTPFRMFFKDGVFRAAPG
jgi:hypothetical protein